MLRLICLSGVPGTGKTSVCRELSKMGINCVSAEELYPDCVQDGEADIDCMRKITDRETEVCESHFSHLLNCQSVIILTSSEDDLEARMRSRGYPQEKISDNIETQRSGAIYYEALQNLPSSRVTILNTSGKSILDIAREIRNIALKTRQK
ncbi:MAG: AAA family ATPase [Candidatus Thermoplasmatota archaeon]|nr:AAA family ATPase [Candidatus Thermoplasmatota archaeon]MCL5785888.1 AAA family ATPase [Candidatus Thermoplasmatota archaeon]